LRLAEVDVGIQQWRPRPRYVTPFAAWASGGPSPAWYDAYNAVKHSRRVRFADASLLNAVTAAAGVFATLIMAYDASLWPTKTHRVPATPHPTTVDLPFEDCPFTLRVPWGAV
jgi:hypothetical protein